MIGDTVLYHYPGPKKPDRTRDVLAVLPAIVTAENEDKTKNLLVLRLDGVVEPRTSIAALDPKAPKHDRFEVRK